MSVSGNEETGVKPPPSLHPSFNIAGVPIKKRRFIPIKKRKFNWPASPPPEEQASPSVQEECPSEDSTPSNSNVAAGSSGVVDMGKNFAPKEDSRHLVAQIVTSNDTKVKIEEPDLTTHSDSLSKFDNEEKFMGGETSVNILMTSAKPELSLSNKAPVLGIVKESETHIITNGTCKPKMSCGNPDLALGLKEHPVFSLHRCIKDGCGPKPDKVEPLSLNCSLSEGERGIQLQMGGKLSNTDSGNDLCANRSNWDLNTTMDAWEGSESDVTESQVIDSGSNTVVPHEVKVPECSMTVVRTSVLAEKQLLGLSECRPSTSISQSSEPYNSEDSLHLSLSPSLLSLSSSQTPSSKKDSGVVSHLSLPTGLPIVNASRIKLEPPEENLKSDFSLAKISSFGPLETSAVKPEFLVKFPLEAVASSNFSSQKIVGSTLIKPEPFHDSNVGRLKTQEGMSPASNEHNQVGDSEGDCMGEPNGCSIDKKVLLGEDSSGEPTCLTGEPTCLTGEPTCLTGEPTCLTGEPTCLTGEPTCLTGEPTCLTGNLVPLSEDVATEPSCSTQMFQKDVSETFEFGKDKDVDNSKCNLTPTDDFRQECNANDEFCVSDEERVNLSGDMLGESSCSLDYESDGVSVPMDIEDEHEVRGDFEDGEVRQPRDANNMTNPTPGEHGGVDDFEDGEVREPQRNDTSLEVTLCKKVGVDTSCSVVVDEKANSFGVTGYDHPTSSDEQKDGTKDVTAANEDSIQECVDAPLDGKTSEDVGKDSCEKALSITKTVLGHPLDTLDEKVKDAFRNQFSEQPYAQAGGPEASVDCTHDTEVDLETCDAEKEESALPKVEALEENVKETHNGCGRSRVINLSRASNFPSPGKKIPMSGRSFPSHPGRERLPDVPLEYKLHPRGRDELYNAGFHKFPRDRHQDQFPRNSRMNFVHGRGRMSGRIRGDRDSERDFDSELYAGPSDFGVPRLKYASPAAEVDAEFINQNNGQDDSFVGNIRGGRKLLDDDTPIFRQLSSRRRSPGRRDGPASRNFTMARRVQRSIDDDSSEAIGVRHTEKMMRGFPEDGSKHTYARPQHHYDRLDGHFVQGTRNFSSGPRRGLPQIRSKSPVRSRSPGPWSSSRRRSPDAYGELPHRRSPLYRMERMRSPDHTGFPREAAVRRHGSPSYMSRENDLRDMDPGHTRPIMPNRSQTGRVFLRNNRRFISDPRDRADGEELYGGPVHSGRFHDLGTEGNGEERRRFPERRGPIRSFRPSFNTDDGENFHLNPEDGPRPFRFLPDDNAEFHGRASLREREFDRQIKNRAGNATRRPRGTEEQEGDYRTNSEVLYDDGFDEVSRVKRKRF